MSQKDPANTRYLHAAVRHRHGVVRQGITRYFTVVRAGCWGKNIARIHMVWVNGIVPLEGPRDKQNRNLVTSQAWAREKAHKSDDSTPLMATMHTGCSSSLEATNHPSLGPAGHALSEHTRSPTLKMLLLALEAHFKKILGSTCTSFNTFKNLVPKA